MKYKSTFGVVVPAAHAISVNNTMARWVAADSRSHWPDSDQLELMSDDAKKFYFDPQTEIVVEDGAFTIKDVEGKEHQVCVYENIPLSPESVNSWWQYGAVQVLVA